jgi:hypothetical protein
VTRGCGPEAHCCCSQRRCLNLRLYLYEGESPPPPSTRVQHGGLGPASLHTAPLARPFAAVVSPSHSTPFAMGATAEVDALSKKLSELLGQHPEVSERKTHASNAPTRTQRTHARRCAVRRHSLAGGVCCSTALCGVGPTRSQGGGTAANTARPTAPLSSPVTWSTISGCLSMTCRRCRPAAARCGTAARPAGGGTLLCRTRSCCARHAPAAGWRRALRVTPGGGTRLGGEWPPVRDAAWLLPVFCRWLWTAPRATRTSTTASCAAHRAT